VIIPILVKTGLTNKNVRKLISDLKIEKISIIQASKGICESHVTMLRRSQESNYHCWNEIKRTKPAGGLQKGGIQSVSE
jgi:hypothetical protein